MPTLYHPQFNREMLKIVQTSRPAPAIPGNEEKTYFYWEIHIEGQTDRVEKVKYNLHESFRNPVREIFSRGNGFKIKSKAWGICQVLIEITELDGTKHKAVHMLDFQIQETI